VLSSVRFAALTNRKNEKIILVLDRLGWWEPFIEWSTGGFNMQKIVLDTSVETFLSNLPEGTTGIMVGNEYIPFSRFAKMKGNTIWLKKARSTPAFCKVHNFHYIGEHCPLCDPVTDDAK
jgi:hypothetical protein